MPKMDCFIRAWTAVTQTTPGDEHTPPLLRRRVTPVARQALAAAWTLPDLDTARFVFASRHGEISRTLSLLEAIADRAEVSPADFALSVHHAVPALLSIAKKNHRGHTAVAAGADSFCFGLLEAMASARETPNDPVLYLYCDDILPPVYSEFAPGKEEPLVIAMTLTAQEGASHIHLTQDWTQAASPDPPAHPAAFIAFMRDGKSSACSPAHDRTWHWSQHVVD